MRQLSILALCLLISACTSEGEPAAVAAPASPAPTAAAAGQDSPVISDIPPAIEVTPEDVAYGATAERNLTGYFVLPADVVEPVPGVIVIHEQWGLDDYVRAMSRRLAGEGYAVLAVDLFDGQTASSQEQVDALLALFMSDRAATIDNIRQAQRFLEQNALAPRVAVLGFGLGGQWSLEAGLEFGDTLDGVVMLYGQVVNDTGRLAALRAPLLGLFAAVDDSIPVREVTQFRSSLRDIGRSAVVLINSNVGHGFANPRGSAYNHEVASESWDTVLEFLDSSLH
jgi:carboxymethylenebutenolidase